MTSVRLRIAVLNRTFSSTAGGAERYSIALVEQLAARHDIHVFAQSIEHDWPGVTYHRVSMPMRRPRWINQLWFATATWWATRRRLGPGANFGADTGFDVVHSHENTWHGDVQTVHVLPVKYNLFQGRSGWRRALRWLKVLTSPRLLTYLGVERMRYAVQPGRKVVVTSDSLLAIFNATYPAAAGMTSVITPGIVLPDMPPSGSDRDAARQQLDLPQGRPCILFVGNDFRKKGLSVLIDTLRTLADEVILAVVGHSAQLPGFRQQVEAAGLGSRVFFLGALGDVSPAYRAADCLAHPTLEDTFAMVVLEAMAYGLPVVVSSSKYCGVAGLLENGLNALILVDPRDTNELGRSLGVVLDDPGVGARIGREARAFAEKFEWGGIATQQEKLYHTGKHTRDR